MKNDERLAVLERLRLDHPEHDLAIREVQQVLSRLSGEKGFSVTALVSNATGEGRLDIVWYGQLGQLSIEEARSTAWWLLEAAAHAESEAQLLRFLQARVGMGPSQAAAMLVHWRDYRAEAEATPVPEDKPS
jgi:hypothetical protein